MMVASRWDILRGMIMECLGHFAHDQPTESKGQPCLLLVFLSVPDLSRVLLQLCPDLSRIVQSSREHSSGLTLTPCYLGSRSASRS